MSTLLLAPVAIVLDRLFGEPARWHPLVGFGKYALLLEQRLNTYSDLCYKGTRLSGMAGLLLAVAPFVFLTWLLVSVDSIGLVFELLFLYFAIGARSLNEHALRVYDALSRGSLEKAREYTGMIVSRDTHNATEHDLSTATIESVLENGSDAIFAALFWFVVAGAPGVVLYRLVNTLDAMWGYKTERHLYFGWSAARLDDALNYLPARLTALTYAFSGNFLNALKCAHSQAGSWKSPNAGVVMSAGAGALSIQLGGKANYQGKQETRPLLGNGTLPSSTDILRAMKLVHTGIIIWVLLFVVIWGVLNFA